MSVLREVERFSQQAVVAAAFFRSPGSRHASAGRSGSGRVYSTAQPACQLNDLELIDAGGVGGSLSGASLRQEGLGQQERSREKFTAPVTGDALESYQQAVGTCAGDSGAVSC